MKNLISTLLLCFIIASGFSQESPGDVCKQFLETLSGKTTKVRNWKWLSAHLSPDATFTMVNQGKTQTFTGTAFLDMVKANSAKGEFNEVAIQQSEFSFKSIAEVKQSYEKWGNNPEEKTFGMNFYHLVFQDDLWKIRTVIWEKEILRENLPLEF